MRYLGFSDFTLEILKSYLQERYQVVSYNGHYSSTIQTGPNSVIQGSVLSCLLFLIFNLDQPFLAHMRCDHKSEHEVNECSVTYSINYIDDSSTAITANNWDELVNKAEEYIKDSKIYNDSNELIMNEDKTEVMFITTNKQIKNKILIVNNNIIKHSNQIKMLGLIFIDTLSFISHI